MSERMNVLLRNAARCFHQMYSPFCHEELSKMDVTADECKDLSDEIGDIIETHLELFRNSDKTGTKEIE